MNWVVGWAGEKGSTSNIELVALQEFSAWIVWSVFDSILHVVLKFLGAKSARLAALFASLGLYSSEE